MEEAIYTQRTSSKMEFERPNLPSLIIGDVLVAYRGNSKRQIQPTKAAGNIAEQTEPMRNKGVPGA